MMPIIDILAGKKSEIQLNIYRGNDFR
ncbi:hypothetical protein A1C_03815 [Rickettsia akari str. Hartford]|uniref:Uncharacterized protein n=1 Tax=Rickettsia akari (strain Hartford) TaxID=293614 RepID=A8GNR3_RICAH|nr:hypothetical protein A1C_03815 [Rickettsia akari str. Hartford]